MTPRLGRMGVAQPHAPAPPDVKVIDKRRSELVEELRDATRAREKDLPPLTRAAATAAESLQAAKDLVRERQREYGEAETARMSAQSSIERREERAKSTLLALAPVELEDLVDAVKRAEQDVFASSGIRLVRDERTGLFRPENAAPALQARLRKLKKVRADAEALALTVTSTAKLVRQLEELRSTAGL